MDQEMLELRACKEWKIRPREWRGMSVDDRALVMAYELFTNTRDNYIMEWKDDARERKEKGKGAKPENPYKAMKRTMGLD
jgi:hypothetical protein